MTKAVIFDIDGTLANCDHRRHHLLAATKDWDSFYAAMDGDDPIACIVELARTLDAAGMAVVLCSGRPSNYRSMTERWLRWHSVPYHALYMRCAGDHRDDVIVKREMLQDILAAGFVPAFVVDDRAKVVKMWREEGLVCLQCAEGDF